jgi:hypothetical protein
MICKIELKAILNIRAIILTCVAYLMTWVLKVFENPGAFEILSTRIVTLSKLHTKASQILGTTVQNLVAIAIWYPVFVLPSLMK